MSADQPEESNLAHRFTQDPQEFYEIKVQGQLDDQWAHWFEGMKLSNVENGDSGVSCTLVSGLVVDQSALHGLLIKIRDLNLKLISVRRIMKKMDTSTDIKIPSEPSEDKDKSQ